jgi:glycosyltransferase involved in cell wall biosynthesis
VYGRRKHEEGYDALDNVLRKENPKYLVTAWDVGIQKEFINIIKDYPKLKWVPYTAIDSLNVPHWMPPCLLGAHKVVSMSEYGANMLNQSGVDTVPIPLGVDTNLFKPIDMSEKLATSGFADKFVVLSVGINQRRKMWDRLIKGYSIFARTRPDSRFLMHTDMAYTEDNGYHIPTYLKEYGVENKCAFTDSQVSKFWRDDIPQTVMNELYNSAKVTIFNGAEGWGQPMLESLAAGVPVIVGNQCSAQELVGTNRGKIVPLNDYFSGRYALAHGVVSADGIANALTEYLDDSALLKKHSINARRFAKGYAWSNIINKWITLLDE